jgi:N-acyl homoserine lactone hydrolase
MLDLRHRRSDKERPAVELYALPLGICDLHLTGDPAGETKSLPVPAFLIRLPGDELVLIDTGMSRLHVDDPWATWRGTPSEPYVTVRMTPEDSLLYRLKQLGLAPEDIDYVINTHLHFDHAGNNDLLGGAKFLVQREQYEYAKDHPGFPNRYWNLPHLSYELLDGEQEPFPGIRVIPTPGHCPGHQSVLFRLPETGQVILCGDAVYERRNYDEDDWSDQADPAVARESALRLLDLSRQAPGVMFYGHDAEQAKTIRWSPSASYR